MKLQSRFGKGTRGGNQSRNAKWQCDDGNRNSQSVELVLRGFSDGSALRRLDVPTPAYALRHATPLTWPVRARLPVIHHHQLSELTMLFFGIALLLPLISLARITEIPNALNCSAPQGAAKVKACALPIAHVTAVVPGSSYIAKIECKDCPFVDREEKVIDDKVVNGKVVNGDQILVCQPSTPIFALGM